MPVLFWANNITKIKFMFFNSLCFLLFACLCSCSLSADVQSISHPLLLPYCFPKPLPFPKANPIQRQFPLFSAPSHSGTNLSEFSCLSPVNPTVQFTQTFNHWPIKSNTEWPHNRVVGSRKDRGKAMTKNASPETT